MAAFPLGHGAPKSISPAPLARSVLPAHKIIPSFVSSDSLHSRSGLYGILPVVVIIAMMIWLW